jgi:tetratricopeptide (TPR) repeat protein
MESEQGITAATTMPRIHANLQLVREPADFPPLIPEAASSPAWPPEPGYPHAVAGVLAAFRPRFHAAQQEMAAAPGLLDDLLQHGPERREMLARNSRRFRSLALCGLLLDQGSCGAADHPEESQRLAALCLVLADALDGEWYGERWLDDTRSRCWSLLSDSRGAMGDLKGAEEALWRAEAHLQRGTHDPLERAYWLACKARLRRAQHRFRESAELFRRALPVFLWAGEALLAAESALELTRLEKKGT